MMQRDIHLKPKDLLNSLQFKDGDFGEIALVSGQAQRAKMCLENLESPVKNFTFLGYTFWTGFYKGKKVTVGNGGFYSPDSAFVTELLCEGGIQTLVRLGSCGALKEDIQIGDFVVADKVLRGDGASRYYVDEEFIPSIDKELTERVSSIFKKIGNVHTGGVWTTDALFRETKEIVNPYIEKGAIAVDMVTSPFVTVANLCKKRAAVVLVVSDNLITGQLGFTDFRLFDSEMKMTKSIFELVS
jgi:purine-nucleoside phosphorylase